MAIGTTPSSSARLRMLRDSIPPWSARATAARTTRSLVSRARRGGPSACSAFSATVPSRCQKFPLDKCTPYTYASARVYAVHLGAAAGGRRKEGPDAESGDEVDEEDCCRWAGWAGRRSGGFVQKDGTHCRALLHRYV